MDENNNVATSTDFNCPCCNTTWMVTGCTEWGWFTPNSPQDYVCPNCGFDIENDDEDEWLEDGEDE